jgi:hypothetical protein
MQAMQRLRDDAHHDFDRQALARSVSVLDQLIERDTFHVLHHQRQLVADFDDVEGLYDVGVIETRNESNLVLETRDELGVACQVTVQALDREQPAKPERPLFQS